MTLPDGRVTNRVTIWSDLGSGLHYMSQDGQWKECVAQIDLFQDGAVAWKGAHQASFSHNANVSGGIQLVAPDGKIFRSHVIGISVYDPKSEDSELIAQLKDSVGELHPPNVVIIRIPSPA